ncbi:glycosyltransferase family 2 protein [Myxosarcina sp. GI1(2024)]
MLISICVITYKRPEGLRLLLKGINEQVFRKIECPEIEVIVVDNDTSGLAERICEEIELEFQWKLKTGVEAQRGITYARNHSISMVSPDTEFIAILDDDEIPEGSWLENLLLVQQEYGSDIVTGPVVPLFEDSQIPDWIMKGKFFQLPRYQTGERRPVAFTNNVLVKAEILRKFNPVFDNRFATSGGSDSYLFLTLNKAGYKITWADKAIVYDIISESRTNLKWILFRGYRTWSNHSSHEKELHPSFSVQSLRVLKGFGLIITGTFGLVPSLFMGKAAVATSLLYIFRGMGTLGGLLGLYYQEYKKVSTLRECL